LLGSNKNGGSTNVPGHNFLGVKIFEGSKMMGSKFVGGPNLGVQHFKWGKFFKLSKNVGGQKGGKI
jgi:hypothetical protein